jgi:hypothetical protein
MNPSDIHALSNEQLNIACAKVAGCKVIQWNGTEHFSLIPKRGLAHDLTESEEDAWKTAPKYSTDASASMELLDLLVESSEIDVGVYKKRAAIGVRDSMTQAVVDGPPSVALPRAISEAFLIYAQSKEQANG